MVGEPDIFGKIPLPQLISPSLIPSWTQRDLVQEAEKDSEEG